MERIRQQVSHDRTRSSHELECLGVSSVLDTDSKVVSGGESRSGRRDHVITNRSDFQLEVSSESIAIRGCTTDIVEGDSLDRLTGFISDLSSSLAPVGYSATRRISEGSSSDDLTHWSPSGWHTHLVSREVD